MFRRFLFLTLVPVALLLSSGVARADTCGILAPCEPPPPSPPPTTPPPPAPEPAPQPPTAPTNPNPEQRLLELMNRDRAEAGAPALAWRNDVAAIAEDHSGRMAAEGRIWHNDDFFSADSKRRLGAKSVGENVALNKSIDDAHRRLMNSPGHRANILNPRFTQVGIGVVKDADGDHFITEGFVEPNGSQAARPAAPAPGPGAEGQAAIAKTGAKTPRTAPAAKPASSGSVRMAEPVAAQPQAEDAPAATTEDTVPSAEGQPADAEPQVLSRGVDAATQHEAAPRAVPPLTALAAVALLAVAGAALLRSARSRRPTV